MFLPNHGEKRTSSTILNYFWHFVLRSLHYSGFCGTDCILCGALAWKLLSNMVALHLVLTLKYAKTVCNTH